MGYRICYIASKLSPEAMAKAFNLTIVRSEEEMPDSEWWVARLTDGGWSVLWSEDETFGTNSEEMLVSLSHETDVIHCVVNETVMWSSSELWSQGSVKWTVLRASFDGVDDPPFHIETDGKLPEHYEAIKNKYFAAQKDDDTADYLYEIPLELARTFINFRHENYLKQGDVDEFRILAAPG